MRKWQFDEPRENELDPELLMWWVHNRIDFAQLPERRIVLQFTFSDHPQWFWILKDSQGPSVCMQDPGFDIDANIETDLSTMYQVWLGKLPLRHAMRSGRIAMHGTPGILRRLPDVLQLSQIAGVVSSVGR